MYELIYHPKVVSEDIPKLSKTDKERCKKAIEQKLIERPELFSLPLRTSLAGYRKLRVGDYRIILKIKSKQVIIFAIQHRSVVYSEFTRK